MILCRVSRYSSRRGTMEIDDIAEVEMAEMAAEYSCDARSHGVTWRPTC